MIGPSAASVALLSKPKWTDALAGALATWGYFAPTVAVVSTAMMGAAGGLLLTPFVFVFALIVSGVVGGVLSLSWGLLTGMLLARLMSRSAAWQLHAAAFFVLGATTALLVVGPYLFSSSGFRDGFFPNANWPIIIVLMIVTGGCVVAGWGFAWWRAIRLSRAELAVLAE